MKAAKLTLSNVHKRFHENRVLKGFTMELAAGDLRLIVGPNGAGKTTLFNIITGFTFADFGQISLGTHGLRRIKPYRRSRLGIARSYQIPNVPGSLTVEQSLALAVRRETGPAFTFRVQSEEVAEIVTRVMADFNMEARRHTLVSKLSHGEKKLLDIGCALVSLPTLLLLDEPTSGLSSSEIGRVMQILANRRGECSMLIIEHDMDFVRDLNAQILFLNEGQVVCEGRLDQIQSNAEIRRIYFSGRRDGD